ncbi:MAG TPA: LLM class flavin-dependent oxidoreductase [Microlunatus sp.]
MAGTRGPDSTLSVIELGEQLGFDSAWVRHRHLQYGISSPIAVLAAASQRTLGLNPGSVSVRRCAGTT